MRYKRDSEYPFADKNHVTVILKKQLSKGTWYIYKIGKKEVHNIDPEIDNTIED